MVLGCIKDPRVVELRVTKHLEHILRPAARGLPSALLAAAGEICMHGGRIDDLVAAHEGEVRRSRAG